MEFGPEDEFKSKRTKFRWTRLGSAEKWDDIVQSEKKMADTSKANGFCKDSIKDGNMDNSGENGVENIGAGTLDLENKLAEVHWQRPFDVTSDWAMTLKTSDVNYKIVINYNMASRETDTASSGANGHTKLTDAVPFVI